MELEKRIESLQKAKLHYKQQWGHALKELSLVREEQSKHSKRLVEQQQVDLDQMRIRYLAEEEKKLLNSDFDELRRFREELCKLNILKSEDDEKKGSPQLSISPPQYLENPICHLTPVSKLIEERDTLLRTGVYNNDDRIILNLEKKISVALAAKK